MPHGLILLRVPKRRQTLGTQKNQRHAPCPHKSNRTVVASPRNDGFPPSVLQSLAFFAFLAFLSPSPDSLPFSFRRFVKRALPRPVPMVSTPQRSTSCMNGTSASPCTTPSLCIKTAVSWSPIAGIASTRLAGRLNLLLSQFPGRFC